MTKTDADHGVAKALWAVASVGVVATVGALVLVGPRPMQSVAVGALIAASNLWVIALVVRRFLSPGHAGAPWWLLGASKLGILVGALYLLLKWGWVDLLPLVVGYGSLPLGIVASQLWQERPLEGGC